MGIERIITTTVLTLALIIISTTTAAAISCDCGDICVNTTGWWNDGGAFNASTTPIQAAVDNATASETICVAAGSYNENVDIATPQLTLRGEGADMVTVNAADSKDSVFYVTADYVNISGFTATGATANWTDAGFHLNGVYHCNISENDASNNDCGIILYRSSNNTLVNNNASNNLHGIPLWRSSNNTLTSNTALNNTHGIYMWYSSNNTFSSNLINSNNYRGICITSSSNHNSLVNNNASNNYHGIALYNSSNNTLTGNTADSNNNQGIILYNSSNNTLASNLANSNSNIGIHLSNSSSNNTLTGNTANSNSYYGIFLYSSSNNLIYNNYFNNTNNAYDNDNNIWNTTPTLGTNIIGGLFLGGNYWSDYAGVDNDVDGLGNTMLPYNSSGGIQNGGDYHPLVPCADTTPLVITITTPEPYGLYSTPIGGVTLDWDAPNRIIVGNLTNTSGVSQNVDSGDLVSAVGVYTLVVTATDNAGNTNVSDPVFFVVYDPDGGHATGGGWFYPDDESTLSPDGKAEFGFTAKYKDGSSTGKLSFQYKDADLHLKSTSIDWLAISAVSAQFQGTGTINGEGLYTFRVQAKDNGEPGVDVDHFDIKIWNGTDTEADPVHKAKNTISGGNIQVHTK